MLLPTYSQQMTKFALIKCELLQRNSQSLNYKEDVNELIGKIRCLHDLWEDLRERLVEKFGISYFQIQSQDNDDMYEFGENLELGIIWLNAKKFMQSTIRGLNSMAKKRMRQLREKITEQ